MTITRVQRNHIFAGLVVPGVESFKMNGVIVIRRNSEYENVGNKTSDGFACLG